MDTQSNAQAPLRPDLTDLDFASTRSAQRTLWHPWMELAVSLTQDLQELHELLPVSPRTIVAYVDSHMEAMAELLRIECAEVMM
ncbi:hypothetical protein ACTHR6_16860 [Ralstonia holmesii]|uniref:hypothetical protein n=1 Tax=Ralstonia TaxID=48736 RepID=UPI000467F536|nr:hypothetical protein [Ralstonia pickettii]CAJ0684168.1 hypothetical protein R11007_00255 [Ralstonia sp. LMG 32967]